MTECIIILMVILFVLILLIFMFMPIYQIIKIDKELDDMRMDNLCDNLDRPLISPELEKTFKEIDDEHWNNN